MTVKKTGPFFLSLLLLFLLVGCSESKSSNLPISQLEEKDTMESIRPSYVAGQFYPSDPDELREQIDGYLGDAEKDIPQFVGKPRMLVLPHAGYDYSGPVAAYGFVALEGQEYDTAIVVAVSHTAYFDGISIYDGDGYKTPLGVVPINKGIVGKLKSANEHIKYVPQAESGEHSVEVMVPFLQQVLGDDFTLVSIILSGDSEGDEQVLADALAQVVDYKTIVIASSDLTHYPDYDDSVYADTKTIDAILTGDADTLHATIRDLEDEHLANVSTLACGEKDIATIMRLADKLGVTTVTKLKQANSGDVEIGDRDRVVGYGAVAFSKEVGDDEISAFENTSDTEIAFTGDEVLNNAERAEALTIARQTVESYVRDKSTPDFSPTESIFYDQLGAFVTLNKDDNLRGCIGQFEPDQPLWQVLRDMSVAAAAHDTRFYPVTEEELADIEIEISVLSPMHQISDPLSEIEVGKHGVYVKNGTRSGTYLPQVATDNGWDLETFMNSLCGQKAGMSADAWKTGEAEIYVYSAQVFGE